MWCVVATQSPDKSLDNSIHECVLSKTLINEARNVNYAHL